MSEVRNSKIFLVLGVCAAVSAALSVGFVMAWEARDGSSSQVHLPPVASEPVSSAVTVPPVVKVVAVASDTMVFHHDAVSAMSSFDTGTLRLAVPSSGETFRWFSPLGDMVDGGRLERAAVEEVVGKIPAGLVVSVSYFDAGRQVSVLGVLSSPPSVGDEETVYLMKIIDAPGRASSYSTAGNYDIPSELMSVSISVTVVS